jgi:hypothetical protein
MDNLRGIDPYNTDGLQDPVNAAEPGYSTYDSDHHDDQIDAAIEAPPAIGTDERRMQVRAYNFWTSQLHDKNYPSVEELVPEEVEDFREYSVLLDFTSGMENPSIEYLGDTLRAECGLGEDITYLDQVPSRSLLSRITDHYLQIIANRAPVGFEAEFVNDRGLTIMYRGILLPYSSDDDTIDFIYGVINWKEAAPSEVVASIAAEVEDAIITAPPRQAHIPVWADSPTGGILEEAPFELSSDLAIGSDCTAFEEAQPDDDSSLADWLNSARTIAETARSEEARSRETLYKAIGRAYDFSLVASKNAADYAELLADSGVKAQERAPMTPVAKLVFGAGYDKTRLTEIATALNYAHRNAVPMGGLSDIISVYDGGLKGIITAERQARKVAKGGHVAVSAIDPRERLRMARTRDLTEFAGSGDEFIVLVARRDADGNVHVIGAVDDDKSLTEKALNKIVV